MVEGLVSIVIPIYNVEKYLNRCVDSVIHQTYRNIEIILIDDGSPDKSPQLCDDWCQKDSRIRVVHKQNAGLGMARNTGIENAAGEFICFFDSDDFVETTLIEKVYKAAKKYDAQSVIYGYNCVAVTGEVRKTNIPIGTQKVFKGAEVRELLLLEMIDSVPNEHRISKISMSAWSKLYSMELIQKTGWRFCSEREYSCEDLYSHLHWYADVDTAVVIFEPLYNYCDNGTSLTKTYRTTAPYESEVCYEAMLKVCREKKYDKKLEYRLGFWYFGSIMGISKSVMGANISEYEKILELKKIVQSEHFNAVMKKIDFSDEAAKRCILQWVVKNKMYRVFYCILKIQQLLK